MRMCRCRVNAVAYVGRAGYGQDSRRGALDDIRGRSKRCVEVTFERYGEPTLHSLSLADQGTQT